jgi:hypothetical protein
VPDTTLSLTVAAATSGVEMTLLTSERVAIFAATLAVWAVSAAGFPVGFVVTTAVFGIALTEDFSPASRRAQRVHPTPASAKMAPLAVCQFGEASVLWENKAVPAICNAIRTSIKN